MEFGQDGASCGPFVLGFVGSSASPAVIFILPGIFYRYMHKNSKDQKCHVFGAIVSVVFGCILVVLSLVVFFLDHT